ncbi:MAG: hypothetical protein V4708_17420 [Bacteroidota bacterium]
MYFVTIQNGKKLSAFGTPTLALLMDKVYETLPIGTCEYRIVSSAMIFSFTLMYEPRYSMVFTNIPTQHHIQVCEKIFARMEKDIRDVSETDSETELEIE